MAVEIEEVFCANKTDLQAWLGQNHTQKESIWLVYYKPTTKKGDLTWSDIVDIAICYGWIDSLPGKVDDERTKIRLSPRNPKSRWSRINKAKVERLIEADLMHPAGLELVEKAKQNGAWTALDEVEDLILPQDFAELLASKSLLTVWEAKSRTFKRGALEQLLDAKKPETRLKKMDTIITGLIN